jgi:hypothetical protein
MERIVNEVGESTLGQSRGRNPPVAEPASLRTDETASRVAGKEAPDADSCIAGTRIPTSDTDHRGVLSDVELPGLLDAFHEFEAFVRRNPWPMLALGFAAGYWLSRNRGR